MQERINQLEAQLQATKVKAWDSLVASGAQVDQLQLQLRNQSGLMEAVIFASGLKPEEVKENPELLINLLSKTFLSGSNKGADTKDD